MNIFNGVTMTVRRVADPRTDHILPGPRSLSWRLITTPAALLGVQGEHCQLVHGDHWREIKRNEDLEVVRNQNITIEGKHKETIEQDCYQNVIGPHLVTNHAAKNELALGRWTKIYGNPCLNQSQEGIYAYSTDHRERYDYCEQHHGTDISFFGFSLSTYVLQLQLAVLQAVASLITLSATLLTGELEIAHAEVHASHLEVHLVHLEP